MNIDIELLDKCSELSKYERDLINRVGVSGETQRAVAKLYKKLPLPYVYNLKKRERWTNVFQKTKVTYNVKQ